VENFTPLSSLIGGILIGLAASGLLLLQGRIAGISGIFAGVLAPRAGEFAWRASFIGGLVAGGVALMLVAPATVSASPRSLPIVALAGLLVGFGTRLGSGCTSGHGVCGLTRFSPRSAVAVCTFMGTGMALASLVQGVL
jgi:hypothetical protein